MTIFTVGVILHWVFISYELHNRFQQQFKNDDIRRFHEFFHIFVSHGLTWIITFVAYILTRKDLIIVKRDFGYVLIYVATCILCFLLMYGILFIKAYKATSGTYEQKWGDGHKVTWYVYQFIVFTRPLFMQNPILNVSPILLWTKAVALNIILYITFLGGISLCMLSFWKMFNIKLFKTKKEYREYVREFNNIKQNIRKTN